MRLQTDKLETLAEFAAGAGHEINNPLAVISGQAQYLLGYESDPGRQKALQTIIGQTQRIHDLLTELMQFARPAKPHKRPIDVGSLMREVTVALGDLAAQRQVRLVSPEPEHPLMLNADPRQLRTALTCLLRNAIEAAPPEGWAGVRVQTPTTDRLELLIEDSGPGPAPRAARSTCSIRSTRAGRRAAAAVSDCRRPGGWPASTAATCISTSCPADRRASCWRCCREAFPLAA